MSGLNIITEESSFKQDTAVELRKRNVLTAEQSDTNFTYEKYAAFLTKISDTSKYIVLPLNEFRNAINSNKIVIGLRHDVDINLNLAFQFSETESKLGFRSTYFVLHTAPYYLANPNNMSVHSENIIPLLKTMQNDKHFEIGWHNDLVTLQAVYNIDPVSFLKNELAWLRINGINIYGSASHGSKFCYVYYYLNYYFFEECTYPVVGQFVNNITLPIGGIRVPMKKGKFSDFDLEYEAYFLNYNKAFSDATITNGIRWNIGMLDLNQLQTGDRVIILLHPIHWHKASVNANIQSFRIAGQKSCSIDTTKSEITVEMPYGTDKNSLLAVFSLSPGAYAKVSGKLQVSGSTLNNFNNPVTYTVYAENRDRHKEWTINVRNAKNSACDFQSFIIPGLTRSVTINTVQKTILVKVSDGADLLHLPVQFVLSPGARAWIDNDEQFSNSGTINFSNIVNYKILAEDGISSSTWTVTVQKPQYLADFISYSVPGLIKPAIIDTLNKTVNVKINADEPLNILKPSFELSANARAWIGKQEQFSEVNVLDFTDPVEYDIVSEDSILIKRWTVTILQNAVQIEEKHFGEDLLLYPNPSNGLIHLQFQNIRTFPTRIDIYNALGEKVYAKLISKTGNFTVEADLNKFPAGVYIVKYSNSEKPLIIIIQKH